MAGFGNHDQRSRLRCYLVGKGTDLAVLKASHVEITTNISR